VLISPICFKHQSFPTIISNMFPVFHISILSRSYNHGWYDLTSYYGNISTFLVLLHMRHFFRFYFLCSGTGLSLTYSFYSLPCSVSSTSWIISLIFFVQMMLSHHQIWNKKKLSIGVVWFHFCFCLNVNNNKKIGYLTRRINVFYFLQFSHCIACSTMQTSIINLAVQFLL
jgi:hypothetical protein